MTGLLQVYTGPGKGKTTAAIGLAVRVLGHGGRVLLTRFLKPLEPSSGELKFLEQVSGMEILTSGLGIVHGQADREDVGKSVVSTFDKAAEKVATGSWDLVILDEINNAVHRDYIGLDAVLDLIDHRPEGTEMVLTGRHAHREIVERADLVTVMEMVKHPFNKGVPARRGIEY